MTPTEQLQEQIAQLQQALITSNPGMPTMLRTIHRALQADAHTVTLLSKEEIGILVSGLLKQTNTVIATTAAKSSTKKLKNISMSDL